MPSFLLKNCLKLGGKSLFFCLTFFVFAFDVFAQTLRPTTFDDRGICEKTKGVWRQFGNGCADNCEAKFDRFSICTQALVFACDCGKNSCWDGESCVAIKDYKKIFEAKQQEEQKLLDEAKEKRKADALANQAAIMVKFAPKDANGNPIVLNQNQANNQNPAPVPAPATTPNPLPNVVKNPDEDPIPTSPITEILPEKIADSVAKQPTQNSEESTKNIELPPFILKKQARDAAENQKKSEEKKTATSTTEKSSLPPLPEVPLPK